MVSRLLKYHRLMEESTNSPQPRREESLRKEDTIERTEEAMPKVHSSYKSCLKAPRIGSCFLDKF